jgi:hypothetical protein
MPPNTEKTDPKFLKKLQITCGDLFEKVVASSVTVKINLAILVLIATQISIRDLIFFLAGSIVTGASPILCPKLN